MEFNQYLKYSKLRTAPVNAISKPVSKDNNGINNTATAFPQTDLLETEMSFENVQPFDDLDDLL